MRSIDSLLPDIRIAAPGVPEFVALYALTRSLGTFLDRSEAWREWGPVRTVAQINSAGGYFTAPNHLDDAAQQWARIKRIDMLRWVETGSLITSRTPQQLQSGDPQWRTRTGSSPTHFVAEGEGDGAQVRLYPLIASTVPTTYTIEPRVIVVTDSIANMDLSVTDGQIPSIPDRVFYAFREGIVAGALGVLYAIPGKDWTDHKLVSYYATQATNMALLAKSRADAEYGPAIFTVAYGGIP